MYIYIFFDVVSYCDSVEKNAPESESFPLFSASSNYCVIEKHTHLNEIFIPLFSDIHPVVALLNNAAGSSDSLSSVS